MHHVCLCFSDKSGSYFKHAAVMITSVMENTKAKITFHILTDDLLTKEAKLFLQELINKYKNIVKYYFINGLNKDIIERAGNIFGVGSLYRLFIPELIDADKVLYLDCDIICKENIDNIINFDIKGVPIAGVRDLGFQLKKKSIKNALKLGLLNEYYINAGVMLMDLARMRKDHADFRAVTFKYILDNTNARFLDQDAINAYCQERGFRIDILPDEYNYLMSIKDRSNENFCKYEGKVLHFTRQKPWSFFSAGAMMYWEYYAKVFSGDAAVSGICALEKNEYAYLYDFILREPRVLRMLHKVYEIYSDGICSVIIRYASRKWLKIRRRKKI